jgi:hypothetical protein
MRDWVVVAEVAEWNKTEIVFLRFCSLGVLFIGYLSEYQTGRAKRHLHLTHCVIILGRRCMSRCWKRIYDCGVGTGRPPTTASKDPAPSGLG